MTLSLHQIITVVTTLFPVMRVAVYLIHTAVMVLMTASTRQMKPTAQSQEQLAPPMLSPVETSTASLLDGAVMDIMTAVMGLMRITALHVVQPPALQTSFPAPMEIVCQNHGCAMRSMTAVTVLMRETAMSLAAASQATFFAQTTAVYTGLMFVMEIRTVWMALMRKAVSIRVEIGSLLVPVEISV